MKTLLKNNNSDELIIFLTGWGCDDNNFKNLSSSKDLLICWDYSNLNFDFNFSKYNKFYLVAYSAGAFVSGIIKDMLPEKFELTICINGNPLLFDDYYGIESAALNAMENLNVDNVMAFIEEFVLFNKTDLSKYKFSQRSVESGYSELNALKKYYTKKYLSFTFDVALISDTDKIFIPERQQEYFKEKTIFVKQAAHDIFNKFNSFDEIIKISCKGVF